MLSHYLDYEQQPLALPVGKVVCIGRNYADHAAELNNPVPTTPLLFMKPSTALCDLTAPLRLPHHGQDCQHEIEIAVILGERLRRTTPKAALAAIHSYALGLDLTLRDVQTRLKQQGHPWELAKAFDDSCPLSPLIPAHHIPHPQQLTLSLLVNNQRRQHGQSAQMLFPIADLLVYISQFFTLLPGDVVLTGTPAGVGRLQVGDALRAELMTQTEQFAFETCVVGE